MIVLRITPLKRIKRKREKRLKKKVVSQISQMFLDNSMNQCLGRVGLFFLSIIVNRKSLKNCMIDFGASNTVMPFEIMKGLQLRVDTTSR